MSLIWADGFENTSLINKKYAVTSSVLVSGSPTSRANSGNCFEMDPASSVDHSMTKHLSAADEHATLIFGLAYYSAVNMENGQNTSSPFQLLSDAGATNHINIGFDNLTGANLRAYRGSTLLGTSAGTNINPETWYYIEGKITMHDSTGSVTLRVNNQTVLSLSGIDTKNAGTKAVFDSFRYWADAGGPTVRIDDLYICNGAGSAYNDFLGDIRVETLRPNGNGNSSDFVGSDANSTDNYQLVDESSYSSADYVQSASANDMDLYTFGDMAHTTGAVKGVMAHGVMSKTDTGDRTARLLGRTGGTNYSGPTETLTTSDLSYKKVWEKNPNTTNDWSISEVNAAEFGVEGL